MDLTCYWRDQKEQTKQEVCEAMNGKVRVQWNNMEEGLESLRERVLKLETSGVENLDLSS